ERMVRAGRRAGDEVEVVFRFEALLHDLEVKQAEETGAEPEAEGLRGLRLVDERSVVQPELLHGILQKRVVLGVGRIEARKDHRLCGPVTGERGRGGAAREREGVADATVRAR